MMVINVENPVNKYEASIIVSRTVKSFIFGTSSPNVNWNTTKVSKDPRLTANLDSSSRAGIKKTINDK